jgi:Uma2 family endonuclease
MNVPPSTEMLDVALPSTCDNYSPELPESSRPPTDLPCEDGEPMDTPWHRSAMNQLIDSITYHFRDREDFFVGGNMFLYFREQQWKAQGDKASFRGPDFFYVQGVDRRRPRRYYAVWEEGGRYPNFILELLSPTTENVDRTKKLEEYQTTFRTPEYFLYDPQKLAVEGYRLNTNQSYEPISPDERGWLWSEQLQLWVGPWKGTYLGDTATWPRFYDPSGQLILREDEAMAQRAEQEKSRAEQEKSRADAAEAEVQRLRLLLEQLRGPGSAKPE